MVSDGTQSLFVEAMDMKTGSSGMEGTVPDATGGQVVSWEVVISKERVAAEEGVAPRHADYDSIGRARNPLDCSV
jgi:hypothetical protein